jgi:predicted DNA-binding transcriptional regulator YafY
MQNNYLVAAREDEIEQPRHYILSQIQDVEVMDKTFDAKGFDIHKYAQKSFGAWISSDGGHKIKWRVSPEAAERARQFIFHPTQKITPQEDGSLIVEFVADGLKEMAWHLMTWEGKIQPLAPRGLIEESTNQLKLAAQALK